MVVVEVVIFLIVAIVLITTVVAVGRPVAEMFCQKVKFKYNALGSEAEAKLTQRISSLEEELRQLRQQLLEIKETSDFTVKLLEDAGVDTVSKLEKAKDL